MLMDPVIRSIDFCCYCYSVLLDPADKDYLKELKKVDVWRGISDHRRVDRGGVM